ncbi:MAG: N-acetylneuraminate synthase family protein [Spirochaetaceae bacterium]|nr:N-acetylneuraminate synthase family protein [Spirochaetaceae bacterium]MBO4705259.1 N-acetylneuraminate synthase family protein [Spirochaetaceae bacterium]
MPDQASTYIIAEIGTSHGGSLEKAYELIDAAKNAGADCAKFQWIYADEILHPKTGYVQLPTGSISLYERFKSLEQPISFYLSVQRYTKQKGLDFGCSPFGIKSLRRLYALKPDLIKIASPELNHYPMLKELARLETCLFSRRIPVVLSSGVSLMTDIEKALKILKPLYSSTGKHRLPPVSLLHCITCYPAPETEYNLSLISTLSKKLGIQTGVSDHSLDPLLVPLISVAAGGRIIEKHITLSKETDGLDDPVALTPDQFSLMTTKVRELEQLDHDMVIAELYDMFGEDTIEAIMGDGEKKLAPSEEQNYTRTNRSIHVMGDMKAGQRIRKKDISVLRTEKILTPGMSPEFFHDIIGKRLKTDVTAGSGLIQSMIS